MRRPTAREREVIEYLLAAEPPRAAALRAQLDEVVVTSTCACGCASIELAVPTRATTDGDDCGLPVAEAASRDGVYELLLFAATGRLRSVEIHALAGEPPAELPPPEALGPPRVWT